MRTPSPSILSIEYLSASSKLHAFGALYSWDAKGILLVGLDRQEGSFAKSYELLSSSTGSTCSALPTGHAVAIWRADPPATAVLVLMARSIASAFMGKASCQAENLRWLTFGPLRLGNASAIARRTTSLPSKKAMSSRPPGELRWLRTCFITTGCQNRCRSSWPRTDNKRRSAVCVHHPHWRKPRSPAKSERSTLHLNKHVSRPA